MLSKHFINVLFLVLFLISPCNGHPQSTLLFTTAKDIRTFNTSRPIRSLRSIIQDIVQGNALDYDSKAKQVCWSDLKPRLIQCAFYDGVRVGPKVSVVDGGEGHADGIAIDWISRNLYWTDSEAHLIQVVSLDGKWWRRVVLWGEEVDQPRAIALSPYHSVMFWTDWGEVAKIERADMDGRQSSRRTLVTKDIYWPNGLTVDYDAKKLYWIDAMLDFIDEIDFEGRNRRTVTNKGVLYPFALTFSKGKLYWTDWRTWTIYYLEVEPLRESPRELLRLDSVPAGLQVTDHTRQQTRLSPCQQARGGCSHLCLLSTTSPGYVCACPTGVRLIDNTTCDPTGPQEMLVLLSSSGLSVMSLDTPDFTGVSLNVEEVKHAVGIDYDYSTGWIYWTDDVTRSISRVHLNGSGAEEILHFSELVRPEGIAVDWRAHNLYWTDIGTNRIEVLRINTTYTKVVIGTNVKEPKSIAVSPDDGYMFWSDWNDTRPTVERAALDGSMRRILVSGSLRWPNGLTLDLTEKKIYWCDYQRNTIEAVNFDGSHRVQILHDNFLNAFQLTIIDSSLFWADWQGSGLETAEKITGDHRQAIFHRVTDVVDLKGIKRNWLPPTLKNVCSRRNGNCEHLCLNRPENHVCACHMGYELQSDQRSCSLPDAFLLYTRKDTIGRMSLENTLNDEIVPLIEITEARFLSVDFNNERLYWIDVGEKVIKRSFLNGSRIEKIVEFSLESPEGLAVDWVAGNIYWTDSGSRRIEVARVDGKYRRAIIWTRLHDPRSITVDPIFGHIFWIDWARQGTVHQALLDGTSHDILLEKVGHAHSLTIDVEDKKLYWCALQGHIEAANTDGTERTIVVSSPRPYSLSIYQDVIYWSDWEDDAIYMSNRYRGGDKAVFRSKVGEVSSMVICHGGGQTYPEGNCQSCGGAGCSQLWLAHCACQTHFTLQDRNKCSAPSSYMLVSSSNSVKRLLFSSRDAPDVDLPIIGLANISIIDYDPITRTLYSIDSLKESIKAWPENGSSLALVEGEAVSLDWLAVDPLYRLVYYSSTSDGTIRAMSDKVTAHVVVVRSIGVEKPRQIALHPLQRLLFWVSEGLSESRINRCRMDGVRRSTLAFSLARVTAFTIDLKLNFIYWATPTIIEKMDINGKNRMTIVEGVKGMVRGLSVFDKLLYWLYTDSIAQYDTVTNRTIKVYTSQKPLTSLVTVNVPSKQSLDLWECLSGETALSLMDCSHGEPCGPGQFVCREFPWDCIPAEWRCDDIIDCPEASDEVACPVCDLNQFTCSSGSCTDKRHVCDGVAHCADNSDEWSCCAGGYDPSNPGACRIKPPPSSQPTLVLLTLIVALGLLLCLYFFFLWRSRGKPAGLGAAPPPPHRTVPDRSSPPHSRSRTHNTSLSMSSFHPPSVLKCRFVPPNPPPSVATAASSSAHRSAITPLYLSPPPTPCPTAESDDNKDEEDPAPPPPSPASLSPCSSRFDYSFSNSPVHACSPANSFC